MILAGGRARSLLSCALLLGAVLAGCGRSDPIVVIAVHPKKPHLLYVATNDYIFKSKDSSIHPSGVTRHRLRGLLACCILLAYTGCHGRFG